MGKLKVKLSKNSFIFRSESRNLTGIKKMQAKSFLGAANTQPLFAILKHDSDTYNNKKKKLKIKDKDHSLLNSRETGFLYHA